MRFDSSAERRWPRARDVDAVLGRNVRPRGICDENTRALDAADIYVTTSAGQFWVNRPDYRYLTQLSTLCYCSVYILKDLQASTIRRIATRNVSGLTAAKHILNHPG